MADKFLKFVFLGGHYMCRCGSTVVVSPKLAGDYEESPLSEGTYDVDDIELPDELKAPEELGQ